eukprot:Nitzschia sp. Nitz4//scaffold43_size134323//42209//44110//NITZ4_003292-RA/size134323-processed-gene-0.36-mRNA-1//-1//CDS//3329551927//6342//frame0
MPLHPSAKAATPSSSSSPPRTVGEPPTTADMSPLTMYTEKYDDAPINQGLLDSKPKSIRRSLYHYFDSEERRQEWMRPYWLGSSLFLLLFAFWMLDSMKDPLFARLVEGKIERHQPTAKLCSVVTTLALVCFMEYMANVRQRRAHEERTQVQPHESVMSPGGTWRTMLLANYDPRTGQHHPPADDAVSPEVFFQVGIPYVFAFGIISFFVVRFEAVEASLEPGFDAWYVLAYALYATVESFGSIAVATFWSYTNSTLSLDDAERYYGPIISLAQLGAIGGSTFVVSDYWSVPVMLILVSLLIFLQMFLMSAYHRRFKPTSALAQTEDDEQSVLTWQDGEATLTKPFWAGLHLIFNHSYVILILGVSCLYEVALTCLDYQMKLLGYAKFELNDSVRMTFAEFMGRYGQVVNFTSLILSSMVFPFLIRRYGLRTTIRLFPTLLLVATIVAYGAMPGNLWVLFLSLSLLKAMTYSIHDPAKEILYIPTSNAVKFRAKFWIDVVGERISKAIGSAFNTMSGSVAQSVRIGSLPSLVSAAGLWFACFYVGIAFDRLLRTGEIVGLEGRMDPSTYRKVPKDDGRGLNPEVEIQFNTDDDDDGSVSTLGLHQDVLTTHTGSDLISVDISPSRPPAKVIRL